MKTLLAKVKRQHLFKPGETVVVAVSGGADSVALLDILLHLDDLSLNLVVAHLNHALRGAESDADEAFVSALAAGYGLPFVARRTEVAPFAKDSRLSLEDAGRKARYAFFAETAEAYGATGIALAHHLDDQAETVLIRLLRGAGGGGLRAMASDSRGIFKRPLLQISRAELEQYLKRRGLSYRTDSTNSDTAILRNSIRHELIPFLRKYNPNVSERLAATAGILAADEELLDELTESSFSRVSRCQGEVVELDGAAVAREPRGLRLRLYRRALIELRGDLQRIALSHLESIDRMVTSPRPHAQVKLPGECFVSRSYGALHFRRDGYEAEAAWKIVVEGEGSHPLPTPGTLLVQRVQRPANLVPESRKVAFLEPDAAPFPWIVRNFQPGDRFRPIGMQGTQKVKDILMNEKVPLRDRRRVPVVESGGRIVWIGGVRLSDQARVTSAAGEVLRVEIEYP